MDFSFIKVPVPLYYSPAAIIKFINPTVCSSAVTLSKDEMFDLLRSMSGMRHVKLANSGNSAILASLAAAKKENPKPFILIPDQGGWLTYETYPKLFNFEIKTIKTDCGILDLEDLRAKARTGAAMLYPSIAGYCADQPMKEIYDICHEAGCLVILDTSASFGAPGFAAGAYCDIMVASFGKWKVVDLGYGGIIASVKKEFLDRNELVGILRHNIDFDELEKKLKLASARFFYLCGICKTIKNDLAEFDIVHKDKMGIVVIVKFKDEEEKKKLINYCTKNKYEYTVCPRYIRVVEDAVSIEIKRTAGVEA